MAKEVTIRRGTTAEHDTFTGAEGEVTVDTTKDTVVVHDGSTAGGFPLAKDTELNNKNLIINGNFNIWQRETTFISVSSGTYTADRFHWENLAGTVVVDIKQSTSVPDNTSDFSLQVDVTTADVSIAAGVFNAVFYRVEGYDAQVLGLGTSDAQNFTLSFWVRSAKTGIHTVGFTNAASDRSLASEYTISSADTWEFKTITVAGDTTGTWLTDNGRGLQILFNLAIGTDFHVAVADTWEGTGAKATSNQVNVMDDAANNFHLSRVQLEVGTVATEFERRLFEQELQLAQRYYFKTFNDGIFSGASGSGPVIFIADATTQFLGRLSFPTKMRVTPTITVFNVVTGASGSARSGGGNVSVSVGGSGQTGFSALTGSGFSVGRGASFHATVNAEL